MTTDNGLDYAHARHPNSRFTDVDLNDSIFDDVALQRVRFKNVALSGAQFNDVNFRDVAIRDANLERAQFENVALIGAQFSNVNLRDAAIRDANLEGMTINGVLVAELFRAYENNRGK